MADRRSSFFLDNLYCEEERLEEEDDEISDDFSSVQPLFMMEHYLAWDDEELQELFAKEKKITSDKKTHILTERNESVEWILQVNSHYGFAPLTPILAINYLDRFISSLEFQSEEDKPWMMQLVAVACISLAAKVEEIHVPLLLDFQVEGTKCVFEAKTIQRMELLVLSKLQWKMNPITPLSFVHHIVSRLGLKSYRHWEFLRRSERLLLEIVSESRIGDFLPSVVAAAIMMQVISQLDPGNSMEYQTQLMNVLKICKEDINECREQFFVKPSPSVTISGLKKRKCCGENIMFESGISSNSWYAFSFGPSPVISTLEHQKKRKSHEQKRMNFPMLLDLVASPN